MQYAIPISIWVVMFGVLQVKKVKPGKDYNFTIR